MILYVWATRTRNGKEDGHTIKFDLATTTIKQLTKVLSCFENYTILNYQHLSNEVIECQKD